MRIFKIHTALLSLLLVLGACDYLDIVPDNVATIDNAFVDKYNAEKYLFTCYSYLPKMADLNSNPALAGSDELSMSTWHEDSRGVQHTLGNQSVDKPFYDYWTGENGGIALYTGIRDCNTFLERIDEVPDIADYERDIWKAEVKFIKAYLHFYLIRMYGPIHIIRESIAITESLDNLKMSRDPLEECFDYVVDLLDEAIADLPERVQVESSELGRITSVIASAVKAKVLVTAASPLFNGESGFQISNHDGTSLFPSENPEAVRQKWEKALAACDTAVSLAAANNYRLLTIDDFSESGIVSDTTKQKVILNYRVTKRENREVIWVHTNSRATTLQESAMPTYYNKVGWGTYRRNFGNLGVPHKITLMYYSNNGVPLEEDVEWQDTKLNEINTAGEDHLYYLKKGYRTLKQNYNREPRYYSDLLFDGALVYGHARTYNVDNNAELDYIDHKQGGHSTAGQAYWVNLFGYWPHKLVNIDTGEFETSGWRNTTYGWPALRLADLYLLYAEALIETGNLDEAKKWIDKIRERAGLKGVDQAWSDHSVQPEKPSTPEGLLDILQQERMIELAFEGSRYWDLRRWLKAEDQYNIPEEAWNPYEETPEGYYVPQTLYYPSFTVKDYFSPIVESELIKNPNLVQSYGW